MATSWLENIPSSSPPAGTMSRSRFQCEATATPSQLTRRPTMLFTSPAQQARKSTSPTQYGTPGLPSLDASSIDPSLQMSSMSRQNMREGLEPPPSTQRPTTGGKQPRSQIVSDNGKGSQVAGVASDREDTSTEDASTEDSSSEDELRPTQCRRFAQTTGESLGLSTKSISDAKQFAIMDSREQNTMLFCMMALIRDNQNDASDSWTPSEDALDNIKAVVKATFLSPSLSEYKGDGVITVVLKILMEKDLGLPEDCFSNPSKRATLIQIIKYWCTETRSDYKKTVKSHTLGENPSNISELAEALLSKTNPKLVDSFELWARLAVIRGTLLRHDHERFWDELNDEMAAIRKRARDKYPAETEGNERAQHIYKEFKKALTNDYKQFGEPLLVQEPPRRNTLKVSDFQTVVDTTAASKPTADVLDSKKRNRKGKHKKGISKK